MPAFICNMAYKDDLKVYNERILEQYGVSSQTAEREIMSMADEGNVVAEKLYGDMLFHKKIMCKYPYRSAFDMYMDSAAIQIDEAGNWRTAEDKKAYPLSFWVLGYYLVNYKRESFLTKCEDIDIIEKMSLADRFKTALGLALSCIRYTDSPVAKNLAGRILKEVAESSDFLGEVGADISKELADINKEFADSRQAGSKQGDSIQSSSTKSTLVRSNPTQEDFLALSEEYFIEAAKGGYVFACNNMAAREAEKIVQLYFEAGNSGNADKNSTENIDKISSENSVKSLDEMREHISRYIDYLKTSAEKYEPYAANRLGLFYITGEITGSAGKAVFREYVDFPTAKRYFKLATHYPDANSAWAYMNLMKYFYKDYEKDIDMMNEHMEYIKKLNPAVYDIAMEL